jgi:two-component sensor histidine kinase
MLPETRARSTRALAQGPVRFDVTENMAYGRAPTTRLVTTKRVRTRIRLAMNRPAPEDTENQLLVERIRLAAKIVIAGILVQMLVPWLLHAPDRASITAVQGFNALIVTLLLGCVRSPSPRKRNLRLMFIGYGVTAVCAGTVGVLAADATTSIIVIVGCALGTSVLVPWGPWWQGAGALVSLGSAIWTIASLVTFPPTYILQNTGSVLPVLAGTVLVSAVVTRQRGQVVAAERERNAREDNLREAKDRLEREIDEHRRTEAKLRFALRELDHRVKNTLATVQAVAQRTLESSQSPAEFSDAFYGRVQAMSRVHEALAAKKWDGLTVRDLVELTVGPYRLHDDSVSILCDESFVSADVARMLSMTFHELVTNAAKYGALSTAEGHLYVSSRIDTADPPRLLIEWRETNGPAVVHPTHRGLGRKLIEEGIAHEVNGVVTLEFPPSGVCCEIDIPMPRASTVNFTARTQASGEREIEGRCVVGGTGA